MAPVEADPPAPRATWRADLWIVAAATLACYVIASALELQESLSHRLARYEHWQADEIPMSLTVLAFGLAWYAFRRRQESQRLLASRLSAEARIADLLAHNRELAQQLISLQENERRALARELHDELGQGCTAIRVETAWLRHCAANDHAGMLAAAGRADAAAGALYHLVRDMLHRLRPPNLDALGVDAALQALCETWQERTGVVCEWRRVGASDSLGDVVNVTLYRVTQEALTNVTRHAAAQRVQVTLMRERADEIVLEIADDGRGMAADAANSGLGLLGATERAAAVGGTLSVTSPAGAGVRLRLCIPLPAAPRADVPDPAPASFPAAGPLGRAAAAERELA